MIYSRYYRSSKNRYIGGVCGGLENYFGIDAIIWRLLFVFMPCSITAYFIMWIFTKQSTFE